MTFSTIPELLDELRAGHMIVMVDDPDRENEGDIFFPAEMVTADHINFILRECRGELCLALEGDICDRLGLEMQPRGRANQRTTAFTVTIEAAEGVTTGISASDRAHTIQVAASPDASPADLTTPGHVHPLRARDGGILVRPGHTEGSVDMCRLAGLRPASVLIEILRDDGNMARLPDLLEFSKKHNLPFPLLSDRDKKVCKSYGAVGLLGITKRALVLIGRDGRVRWRRSDLPIFHRSAADLQSALAGLELDSRP